MNKIQKREIEKLKTMATLGMTSNVALGLSALIRSAMTSKAKTELIEQADILGVSKHPEFIV